MPENVVHFDQAQFEGVMKMLMSIDESLVGNFLAPSSELDLDASLGSRVNVGNDSWDLINEFTRSAAEFGGMIEAQNLNFTKSWSSFIQAMGRAQVVFEQTGDLASYSAPEFLEGFPDIAGEHGVGESAGDAESVTP